VLIHLDAHFAAFVDVHGRFVFVRRVQTSLGTAGISAAFLPVGRIRVRYSGSMFVRRISIQRVDASGALHACPIRWIDNFAMRNFTNDPVFDDTLPAADGLLEAGHRVPIDRLQTAMEDWFRRKGYLAREESLEVREIAPSQSGEHCRSRARVPAQGSMSPTS